MDISQHNFPLRPLRKDAERNPKRFAIPISFAGNDTMANIFLSGDAPSRRGNPRLKTTVVHRKSPRW